MIRPADPNKVASALHLLRLETQWHQLMSLRPRDAKEAGEYLAAWKDKALKPAYRALAKTCHPDQHPDDAAAEEQMKALSEAFNLLKELTVFNRPRGIRGGPVGPVGQSPGRQRVVIIRVNMRGGPVRTDTSATTSGFGTGYVEVNVSGSATNGGTRNS